MEIDYSAIPQAIGVSLDEDWEPPVHKFFGKKLGNGKFEKEPVYVHIEYPRMVYAKPDDKIIARVVHSDEELRALGDGWEKNPSAFGYYGAPSFEQLQEMELAKEEVKPKRGRPAEAKAA